MTTDEAPPQHRIKSSDHSLGYHLPGTFRIGGRLPELDGVRGLAILLVLIWHYFVVQIRTRPGSVEAYGLKFLSLTWAGVDLFFVLSGLLIGGVLMDTCKSPGYFKQFFIRRSCRIFPLYYCMFALFLLGVISNSAAQGPGLYWLFGDPLPLWSYATYTQNISMMHYGSMGPHWMGITWSLAIEEQFYLALPLIIRFLTPRLIPIVFAALAAAAPVFRVICYHMLESKGLAAFMLLPGRWDAFFLGVLGAWAFRNRSALQWLLQRLWLVRTIAIMCGCCLLGLLSTSQSMGSWGMTSFGHTVLALLGLSVIILCLCSENGITGKIVRHPILIWLGTVSYGIYLFHQPMSGLLHSLLRDQAPKIEDWVDAQITFLALGCTFALAIVSWRAFERPIISWGRRFSFRT